MKWLIYGIIAILCYLIFTHNPSLIIYVGIAVLLYWLFFKRSHKDPNLQYWQQEIAVLKQHNSLLLNLIAVLEKQIHHAPAGNIESNDEFTGPNDIPLQNFAELEHLASS